MNSGAETKMKGALVLLILIALGCSSRSSTSQPSGHDVQIPPQSILKDLEFEWVDYLWRREVRATITPDGDLRWMQTDNKSWGPGDANSKYERISVRQGRLAPERISELVALFEDWESLPEQYSARPDEPEITIRYGDKTVSGGALSSPLREIYDHIQKLAMMMPTVER